jgi:hypothetical protein
MASRKTDRSSGDIETRRDVVTLDDLAPRHDVRGGSGRRVFGADTKHFAPRSETMATKKTVKKDLQPKNSPKGGRRLT